MARPTVRVYLLTYRRPALLPRALESLRAQTYPHWVCELHNDAPDEPFPGELVRRLGDPRIEVVNHPTNLGLTGSFNLVFRPVAETYVSILEDDNTWDPHFLESMCALMERYPHVAAGWANLRYWHEKPDGSWVHDGRCIWPTRPGDRPRLYYWPSLRSIVTLQSSNGAMLWRTSRCHSLTVPAQVSASCQELFRERATPHPLLLNPKPLGNFAVTTQTSRGRDRWLFARDVVAVAGSFFAVVARDPEQLRRAWDFLREDRPYGAHLVLMAGLALPGCRFLPRHGSVKDWYYLLRAALGRPLDVWRTLWGRDGVRSVFPWMLEQTRQRLSEAKANGFDGLLQREWVAEAPAQTEGASQAV
jgi:glycosyltransferase involved in cell wall biosynthesis